MNEDKKIDWYKLGALILILLLFINIGYTRYQNRGWKKDVTFENWEFLDYESAENGYNCMLNNCKIIDTKYNTQVKECICESNNNKVRTIATNKREYYTYKNFEALKYEPMEVKNESV